MSLHQKWYQANLSEFKEEVCRNPDADFTQYIQELAAKFIKRENEREKSNIHAMMLSLYEGDTQLLMRDITKVMMLGTAKAAPSQRTALFRSLCEILSLHTKEDFSDIIAMCERIEEEDRKENDNP